MGKSRARNPTQNTYPIYHFIRHVNIHGCYFPVYGETSSCGVISIIVLRSSTNTIDYRWLSLYLEKLRSYTKKKPLVARWCPCY